MCTPTPWHTTDRGYRITIDSGDKIALAEVFPMNEVYEKAANARLIVTAVNAHAQLVEALHSIAKAPCLMELLGETWTDEQGNPEPCGCPGCTARAALRAAEPDENEGDV